MHNGEASEDVLQGDPMDRGEKAEAGGCAEDTDEQSRLAGEQTLGSFDVSFILGASLRLLDLAGGGAGLGCFFWPEGGSSAEGCFVTSG